MADGSSELAALNEALRHIDKKVALNIKAQQEHKDAILNYKEIATIDPSLNTGPNIQESELALATLQEELVKLRRRREMGSNKRQELLTSRPAARGSYQPMRSESKPMPGSYPSAPGDSRWGQPSKAEPGLSRPLLNSARNNQNSGQPSAWRSKVEPIDHEQGHTQQRTSHFYGNMPNNSLRVPSGVSTPGYSSSSSAVSGNKRGLQSQDGTVDLTGSGPSKRPRASASPYDSSPSRHRPHSSGSTASSVIDLTGNDDEVRAAIDVHKRKAAAARRRNVFGGGQWSSNLMAPQGGNNPWAIPSRYNDAGNTPSWLQEVERLTAPQPQPTPNGFPVGNPRVPFSGNFGGYISSDDDADGSPSRPAGASRPSQQPGQPGLSAMQRAIHQTNLFDFANMTDGFGNPLDPRIVNYARDVADDPRMSKSDIDHLLANITPDMDIPEEDRADTPDAMTYPLYKHQKLALDWMTRQEEGANKGGILADDMGLGKTISMLALIVSRQAKRDNFTEAEREAGQVDTSKPWFFTKTNLIVLPKALIRQWEDEIRRKLRENSRLSVVVFHGARKYTAKDLLKYDVVLTTYGTLLADHTRLQRFWKDHEGRNVNLDTDVTLAREVCLFHPKHSLFWRVILDESQHIKNDRSKSAEAACQLMSTYRWCMSGTPMMNSLDEIYPLIRFLRIAPYNDKARFRRAFGTMYGKGKNGADPKPMAMTNFQVLLKAILFRRSKTSKLDGEPIIVLPNKTEEVVHVTMAEEEKKFYTELAANTRVTINEYIRKGTLGKHYSHVLELLLRLRQACCHPHLLDAQEAAPQIDDSMLALAKTMDRNVVERIISKARELVASAEGGFECPICYETISDPNLPLPCGHEICAPCFQAHVQNATLDNIHEGEEGAGAKCPVCRVILETQKVVTFKAFKKVYLPEMADDDEDQDDDLSSDEEEDAVESDDDDSDDADDAEAEDVDANGNLKGFIADSDDDLDDGLFVSDNKKETDDSDGDVSDNGYFLSRRSPKSKKAPKAKKSHGSKQPNGIDSKAKEKSKKPKKKKKTRKPKSAPSSAGKKRVKVKPSMLRHLRQEGKKNKEARRGYRRYLKKNWLPSAKVTACLDLLKKIRDESDGEKTIIFSQWTMLMDFVEVALELDPELKEVGAVRFDGEMSMPERDRAVARFRDDDRTKIMLVSLRAGNAGLNLVSASRVIILDPFWNPFIEMQAVDRAHRIGQQREVKVYRLLVQATVEDRIMEIKERKEKMITSALDEGVAKKLGGLSIADLKRLFDV